MAIESFENKPHPVSPSRDQSFSQETPLAEILRGYDRRYSPVQLFYLDRMHRFCSLRRQKLEDPVEIKLVNKAVYSTLRACDELKLNSEARDMIRSVRGFSGTEYSK